MTIIDKFFYLLQISLGRKPEQNVDITETEWATLFEGVKTLSDFYEDLKPPLTLLYEWIGISEQIKRYNMQMNQKSAMIRRVFDRWGLESCILKGQGVAQLYPQPELRQSGDIDIWVKGSRGDLVKKLKNNCISLTYIDYVNCHALFYVDVEVEVHFRPTWMYNPFDNLKVQRWIKSVNDIQMANYDKDVGFSYPTISFNLVFSLIHIYRHVFQEGIGLRQLMDYYYILTHSTEQERYKAFELLESFGVGKFSSAVMYIMRRVFDVEETSLLCIPNQKEGEYLLSEILRGGNFGYYDDRNKHLSTNRRMKRGVENVKHNFRFIKHYPSEVMWAPAWKIWHWCWRKWNGDL